MEPPFLSFEQGGNGFSFPMRGSFMAKSSGKLILCLESLIGSSIANCQILISFPLLSNEEGIWRGERGGWRGEESWAKLNKDNGSDLVFDSFGFTVPKSIAIYIDTGWLAVMIFLREIASDHSIRRCWIDLVYDLRYNDFWKL